MTVAVNAGDGGGDGDGDGGGDGGGGGETNDSTVNTVYSDVNVSVSQDNGNGNLNFYGANGSSSHLMATLSTSQYTGAAGGSVLGVVLYVSSLGCSTTPAPMAPC